MSIMQNQTPGQLVAHLFAERKWLSPRCCDMHNRHCEAPSELCCAACSEVEHPEHRHSECVLTPDDDPCCVGD